MFLTTPQISQLFCPRATGSDHRNIDLPKYARRQKCRGFTPRRNLYGDESLKPLAPFCDCRADYRQARQTRFYYRLLKSQLLFRMQYGSSMEGKDATNRFTFTQGHLFAHIYGQKSNADIYKHAMNGGRDNTRARQRLQLYIYYVQSIALNSSST